MAVACQDQGHIEFVNDLLLSLGWSEINELWGWIRGLLMQREKPKARNCFPGESLRYHHQKAVAKRIEMRR